MAMAEAGWGRVRPWVEAERRAAKRDRPEGGGLLRSPEGLLDAELTAPVRFPARRSRLAVLALFGGPFRQGAARLVGVLGRSLLQAPVTQRLVTGTGIPNALAI
ncbi:MAG TPA: hypothetical protein DEQ61_21540 [Streptomyces sp.]|nr:hypothetical protein [Streptomyces sp.]